MSDQTAMRRTDRARDCAFAWQVAAHAPYGTLATVDETGQPYAVPVSAVVWNGALYFHGAAGVGKKTACLRLGGVVRMLFVSRWQSDEKAYSVDYASAVFVGRPTAVADPDERRKALEAIAKRYCPTSPDEKTAQYIAAAQHAVDVWRIDVDSVSAKARAAMP
ncbi:MAG: pyridoxamine 5'-phosphate oxidase family protein [Duodenibacillus sp.]